MVLVLVARRARILDSALLPSVIEGHSTVRRIDFRRLLFPEKRQISVTVIEVIFKLWIIEDGDGHVGIIRSIQGVVGIHRIIFTCVCRPRWKCFG